MFKSLISSIPHHLRNNILYLYGDIGVWGLYMGSTVVFLSVYAARIGATPQQIGLLSAIPALVALLGSVPLGILARSASPQKAVLFGGLFARSGLLAYALIPWLVPATNQVNAILWAAALISLPGTLVNICFGPFFLASIPSDWRGTVVAARIAIMSVLQFFTTLAAGQILVRVAFPLNYSIVFFIGFVGAFATLYMIYHVRENQPGLHRKDSGEPAAALAEPPPVPPTPITAGPTGRLRALLPVLDSAGKHYLWVVSLMFVLNLAGFMTAPLIPNFVVDTLKLGDDVISVGSAAGSIIVFGVSLFVARLARRTGNRRASAIGIALVCVQFVILSLAKDWTLYLLSSIIGGIASGVTSSALYNYQLDVLPPADRTVWSSWSSMLGNGAALLGSLTGPLLASVTGVPQAILILALARLAIGMVIWLRG